MAVERRSDTHGSADLVRPERAIPGYSNAIPDLSVNIGEGAPLGAREFKFDGEPGEPHANPAWTSRSDFTTTTDRVRDDASLRMLSRQSDDRELDDL